MFDGFQTRLLETDRGVIVARVGGSGPPLLLLHGYPESHLMWHSCAPLLCERFTVIASDLTGYGESFKPAVSVDHSAHSKRAMALDQVQAMAALGFSSFCVAGHDRGGRVAYRMALDHPERVERLAVLDIVPSADIWRLADRLFALGYWHCGFLAQPAPLPERLIAGDVDAFFEYHLLRSGLGSNPARYPEEVLASYRRQLRDPASVEAICEDYRASAFIDVEHDEADRGRHHIGCPVLVLWSERGALQIFYEDVLALWRDWATDVRGHVIDASHFLVEDRPEDIARELKSFFG